MREWICRASKQTPKKVLNLTMAAVMAFSGLALAGPLLFAPAAYAASSSVSTSLNTNGWGPQDGTPTYVDGPTGSDGNGSLKLTTASQSKQDYFKSATTPLSEVSGLGYKLYDTAGVPASYQLQVLGVNRTDSSSTFTSLVWEPVYNGQTNGPNGGFVSENNLENGIWWSSHPISGADYVNGSPTYVSLSAIQAANPDAVVVAYGVNIGSGTAGATSYVDDVSFGDEVTNFELAPSAANGDFAICTKTAGCGYDGIDVGFSLSDFSSISNISVTLSKNGEDLVTNTAKQDMLDYYNHGLGTILSTPFVISGGNFDPASDTYWSYGSHNWKSTDQPDTASVMVTGIDSSGNPQTISTVNSSLTQGLASFASFFPGQLTVGCNQGDYSSIAAAVAAASAGDTITICGLQNVTSAININSQLNIVGLNGAQIDTTGSDYVFKINPAAPGTTINGLTINKTDTVSDDAMVYVGANDTTISGNTFKGLFNVGDGETIRGLVVAGGLSGLSVSGNTFSHVRQPGYINDSAGVISNNYTEATKGWVAVSESNINFSGNTWATGVNANYEDIAIIPDVPAGANNYADVVAISQANNNAVVENQVSGSKILPSSPIATPTVSGDTASVTLPAANSIVAATSSSSGTVQITIPGGTIITADSSAWDGTITPPTVENNSSVTIPTPSGKTTTVASVIEVGAGNISLTFDNAVRLVLPGQSGKLVGFIRNGNFTQITGVCAADDQSTEDSSLSAGSDCYINFGTDLVVWTKHFTQFVTYSQTASTPSNSGLNAPTNSAGSNQISASSGASSSEQTAATGSGGEVQGESTTDSGRVSSTSIEAPVANAAQPKIAAKEASAGGLRWYWIVLLVLAVLGLAIASIYRYAEGTDKS